MRSIIEKVQVLSIKTNHHRFNDVLEIECKVISGLHENNDKPWNINLTINIGMGYRYGKWDLGELIADQHSFDACAPYSAKPYLSNIIETLTHSREIYTQED